MPAIRIVWGALVIILLAVILYQWEIIEPEVEDTALTMTGREILSSANEFKNYWVVNGQPHAMVKDGVNVTFSALGWPVVLNNNDVNCQAWLALLLPNKDRVYADRIEIDKNTSKKEQYRCDYRIPNGKVISIMLSNGIFKVNVGFLN